MCPKQAKPDEVKLNFTIQDNITLLEAALKHSISWSMRSRRSADDAKREAMSGAGQSGVEIMHCKLADESHVRSFISRFLIELNRLMDLQWNQGRSCTLADSSANAPIDESPNDPDSLDTEEDSLSSYFEDWLRCRQKLKQVPSIKISGKYCGVYNIGAQTDEDDELYENFRQNSNARHTHKARHIGDNLSGESHHAVMASNDDDVDDGYRSLSRSSVKTSLVQQLSELKHNLRDLLSEFVEELKPQLSISRLDAFVKQRDRVINIIDKLIDDNLQIAKSDKTTQLEIRQLDQSHSGDCDSSFSSTLSSISMSKENRTSLVATGVTLAKSENNLSALSGYEEQEQVIDYSCRRASADCHKPRKGAKDVTGSIAVDVNLYGTRGMPIDYGAMMRDYESRESLAVPKATTQVSVIGSQSEVSRQVITKLPPTAKHISSSSSTSEQSSTSHTSSSSFL